MKNNDNWTFLIFFVFLPLCSLWSQKSDCFRELTYTYGLQQNHHDKTLLRHILIVAAYRTIIFNRFYIRLILTLQKLCQMKHSELFCINIIILYKFNINLKETTALFT